MLIRRASRRLTVALAVTTVTLFATFAYGQAPGSRPSDLESEVTAVKAENAAMREQLRKIEEQQRALLELFNRLQRRLDGPTIAEEPPPAQPPGPADAAQASVPSTAAAQAKITFRIPFAMTSSVPYTAAARASVPSPSAAQPSVPSPPAPPAQAQPTDDRYKDGIVLVETSDNAKVPLQLKLTNITQFRYINSMAGNDTFTDHLGTVRPVAKRNDLGVNRSMFTFSGHIFDERLKFGLLTWTSATTTSVIVSGNVSWQFSKAFTLHTGYWGVPGSRTLTYTFPYFTEPERSMADNFFRPGFTQGIWATGEPVKGLYYDVFVGNGLNTLSIPTSKIDTNLMYSASVWWEPLGPYGPEGKPRNSYDDYDEHKKPVIRVGTSYTRSREDRFSNLDQSNPENTSMHNSDGVLTFSTGAFAPGVTVEKATYRMWAIDGGIKWRGLAVNSQYYFRWIDDFVADGPLPLSSTFDQGGELSVSKFVVPKKWMLYGRTSAVFGQFNNSYEVAGGFKWYFVPTQRVWLTGELMRIDRSPYGSTFTPYTAGFTGWVPLVQTIFTF